MTVGLFFLAGICLLLAGFGYIPSTPEERKAERDSWRLSQPMAQSDRVFRQRAYLLHVARKPLVVTGVVSLVAALVTAVR